MRSWRERREAVIAAIWAAFSLNSGEEVSTVLRSVETADSKCGCEWVAIVRVCLRAVVVVVVAVRSGR